MSSKSLFLDIVYGVDWSEPWVLCLLGFHLITLLTIFILRHRPYLQAVIFLALVAVCFCSEFINEYAAANYSWFSEEQYFDPNGLFIFTVFAGPIIFNCFIIVFCWLWTVWNMMLQLGVMKRKCHLRKTRLKEN